VNADDDVVVSVQGLWKKYGVEVPEIIDTIGKKITPLFGTNSNNDIWELQDVSFQVKKGESFGIIGRNGAGKSTLLKIVSGVNPPTKGVIEIKGTLFPMIELNAGMHMDFTGRENVRLLGTIMGLSSKSIDSKMQSIEEFCELGFWFDRPVRHYSSGMIARLGFSVGVHVDADLLIVDEVLSVGDISFQNKCHVQMKKVRDKGTSIIYVSHGMESVQHLCARAMCLENGRMYSFGDSEKVINDYENLMRESSNFSLSGLQSKNYDLSMFELSQVKVLNHNNLDSEEIDFNQGFSVLFKGDSKIPLKDLIFQFTLLNQSSDVIMYEVLDSCLYDHKGPFTFSVHIPPVPLSGGKYSINFSIREKSTYKALVKFKGLNPFFVRSKGKRERGILSADVKWKFTTNE
jgi:lipopolysaccharide transport system ATP-binding protein